MPTEQVKGKRESPRRTKRADGSEVRPHEQIDGSSREGGSQCWRNYWVGAAVLPPVMRRGSPRFLSSPWRKGLVTTQGRGCFATPTKPSRTPPNAISRWGGAFTVPGVTNDFTVSPPPEGLSHPSTSEPSRDRELIAPWAVLIRTWELQMQR